MEKRPINKKLVWIAADALVEQPIDWNDHQLKKLILDEIMSKSVLGAVLFVHFVMAQPNCPWLEIKMILKNAQYQGTLWTVISENPEEAAKILSPYSIYDYAADHSKRCPLLEPIVLTSPDWSSAYADAVIKARWPAAEPIILQSVNAALIYARDIIQDRWPEAEPLIMQHPSVAFEYAEMVMKERWPEAEPIIKTNRSVWKRYQQHFRIK